ncbi:DnaB-like helicase C-terminal domain-containing protein [Loigolactobacillus iwatensis]|uniref:DnaB-like helicase C-terminal domain-containing protein n=1 Tax=Loigolactobacillus iwatensis TaxID=1267156 RepID=UPI000F7E5B35|nr:DnaB-like helicase C-terminal domain-containing protein [Loigolactobacillus iwatensis]
MEFEQNAVAYLVDHPDICKSTEIEARWFHVIKFQHLVKVILENDGDFKDWVDVKRRFFLDYPLDFAEDEWVKLHDTGVTTKTFKSVLQGLKAWYYQGELEALAGRYAKYPTSENMLALGEMTELVRVLNLPELPTKKLSEYADDLRYYLDHSRSAGIKTFQQLNKVLGNGLCGGVLWTIGARPGVGKSAFGLSFIQSALAIDPEICVDHFSLEMTGEDNFNRTLAFHTGIPVNQLRNPKALLTPIQKKEVQQILPKITAQDVNLHDKILVLPQIIKVIRENAKKASEKGVNYFAIIDYLQIVSLARTKARVTDRRLEIEAITRELKLLTNELNIPIILFSQLNRELEKRVDRKPQLADLRESGSIEQDSNIVSFLYLEDQVQERSKVRNINLLFRKNRSGELAEIPLIFDTQQMKFMPLDSPK